MIAGEKTIKDNQRHTYHTWPLHVLSFEGKNLISHPFTVPLLTFRSPQAHTSPTPVCLLPYVEYFR